MSEKTTFASDFQALCALCDSVTPLQDRQQLAQDLSRHVFSEPEHQVVFQSIRALISRGPISAAQLRIHLINRGFPDTDVEKYFQRAPNEITRSQPMGTAKP